MPCCKDQASTSSGACACASDSGSGTLNSTALAVPLPKRARSPSLNSAKPPVWSIDAVDATGGGGLTPPLPAKCDMHTDDREGVCCKDLRGDDERTLIDPDVVRDVVIGLSDGLTVPFALTAGLSGIGDSRIVIVGGLAELCAGAISMGVGGFLASQAERDHFRYLRTHTRDRVQRSCDGEMEREVHTILGPLGVEEKLSRDLADNLRRVENEVCGKARASESDHEATSGENWWNLATWGKKAGKAYKPVADSEDGNSLRWSEDVGLTAFLLKFGEGLEEVPTRRLYISAFTIGMGYFMGGLIPLLPYFFIDKVEEALIWSCVITGVILLIFGAFKTHVTGATGGVGGYLWGAVSMLLVGGGAAAGAFGIVKALET